MVLKLQIKPICTPKGVTKDSEGSLISRLLFDKNMFDCYLWIDDEAVQQIGLFKSGRETIELIREFLKLLPFIKIVFNGVVITEVNWDEI